jgi:hypothetical protein
VFGPPSPIHDDLQHAGTQLGLGLIRFDDAPLDGETSGPGGYADAQLVGSPDGHSDTSGGAPPVDAPSGSTPAGGVVGKPKRTRRPKRKLDTLPIHMRAAKNVKFFKGRVDLKIDRFVLNRQTGEWKWQCKYKRIRREDDLNEEGNPRHPKFKRILPRGAPSCEHEGYEQFNGLQGHYIKKHGAQPKGKAPPRVQTEYYIPEDPKM